MAKTITSTTNANEALHAVANEIETLIECLLSFHSSDAVNTFAGGEPIAQPFELAYTLPNGVYLGGDDQAVMGYLVGVAVAYLFNHGVNLPQEWLECTENVRFGFKTTLKRPKNAQIDRKPTNPDGGSLLEMCEVLRVEVSKIKVEVLI